MPASAPRSIRFLGAELRAVMEAAVIAQARHGYRVTLSDLVRLGARRICEEYGVRWPERGAS